jgi:hypothetical protein
MTNRHRLRMLLPHRNKRLIILGRFGKIGSPGDAELTSIVRSTLKASRFKKIDTSKVKSVARHDAFLGNRSKQMSQSAGSRTVEA